MPGTGPASLTPIPEGLSHFLLTTGDLIAFQNLVPTVLFVLYYGFLQPWRNNFVGRALMRLGLALVITNFIVVATLFLGPDYLGREIVRLAGYGYSGYASWVIFLALLRVRNHNGDPRELQFTETTIERARRKKKERLNG